MIRAAIPEPSAVGAGTRFEAAARTLSAVATASGFDPGETGGIVASLRMLAESWADLPLDAPPSWSGLGADASGCDVSLVLDGRRTEIRVTVEAQALPASPASYLASALRLSERLEAVHDADLSRLRAVEDLFRDLDPQAPGVLWHGAVFSRGRAPWFKVYLHLMARGRAKAGATAHAALERLGMGACWADLAARLRPGDELLFLGFDLLPAGEARVKLYIRHAETDAEALDLAARVLAPEGAGTIRDFVGTLTGGEGVIRRGALTALHLVEGRDKPVRLTTHLRLYPHCATSDAVLFARLRQALRRLGIPSAPYEAAVAALAGHDLAEETGLHGWASLQWTDGRPSVTVYLSPRLYFPHYGPIALDPERLWPSPVLAMPAIPREPACARP